MKKDTEQYWQAYLDGELSASEAADFEASLTDAQREQLAVDMHVERVLAEHLGRDAECPDEVWERTKARVARLSETGTPHAAGHRRWYWGAATLAAAAAIAFVISIIAPTGGSPDGPRIEARTFQQYAFACRRKLGFGTAHDSGDCNGQLASRDQQIGRLQLSHDPIEGAKLSSVTRQTDDNLGSG